MKNKLLFFFCAFMCSAFYAQTGFQTETPQRTVHVNGSLQVTNEINVGGNKDTAGSAGTAGQVLTSKGSNTAPEWQLVSSMKGAIANAVYIQGTASQTINQGTTADVPGFTTTITVPAGASANPTTSLVNVPAPVTFFKAVTLSEGTYAFKVQYISWFGNQVVNHNPTEYTFYNQDSEAMLTKMQVFVSNN